MDVYIEKGALYNKTAAWAASALTYIEKLQKKPWAEMSEAEKIEWLKWQAILGERLAFKFDVEDAPIIDAVKVVRCKDCKHRPYEDEHGDIYEPDWGDYTCPFLCEDSYYSGMPEDDFFCKRGERKE